MPEYAFDVPLTAVARVLAPDLDTALKFLKAEAKDLDLNVTLATGGNVIQLTSATACGNLNGEQEPVLVEIDGETPPQADPVSLDIDTVVDTKRGEQRAQDLVVGDIFDEYDELHILVQTIKRVGDTVLVNWRE